LEHVLIYKANPAIDHIRLQDYPLVLEAFTRDRTLWPELHIRCFLWGRGLWTLIDKDTIIPLHNRDYILLRQPESNVTECEGLDDIIDTWNAELRAEDHLMKYAAPPSSKRKGSPIDEPEPKRRYPGFISLPKTPITSPIPPTTAPVPSPSQHSRTRSTTGLAGRHSWLLAAAARDVVGLLQEWQRLKNVADVKTEEIAWTYAIERFPNLPQAAHRFVHSTYFTHFQSLAKVGDKQVKEWLRKNPDRTFGEFRRYFGISGTKSRTQVDEDSDAYQHSVKEESDDGDSNKDGVKEEGRNGDHHISKPEAAPPPAGTTRETGILISSGSEPDSPPPTTRLRHTSQLPATRSLHTSHPDIIELSDTSSDPSMDTSSSSVHHLTQRKRRNIGYISLSD